MILINGRWGCCRSWMINMEPNFEAEAHKLINCTKQLSEKMAIAELIASMQKMYQIGKSTRSKNNA